jgi:prepilin-type N-terminal cleavage/methylation domain-containing protein
LLIIPLLGDRVMPHLIELKSSSAGFSLIEVLVAMGIVGVLLAALMSAGTISLKQQKQSNITFQADVERRGIMKLINDPTAWGNTLLDANNSSSCGTSSSTCNPLNCLLTPANCYSGQGGNIYVLRDASAGGGAIAYDWLGSDGLTMQGTHCTTFAAPPNAGHDECPLQFQITWKAICSQPNGTACGSAKVLPQISIRPIFNPNSAANTVAFNPANYSAIFYQGADSLNCTWINNAFGLVETCGNVGVGTTNPAGILEVWGGTAPANSDGTNIVLQAQSGGPRTSGTNTNGGNIVLIPGAPGTGGASSGLPHGLVLVSQGEIHSSSNNWWNNFSAHTYSSLSKEHSSVFVGLRGRGTEASPSYPLLDDSLGGISLRDAIDGYAFPTTYGGTSIYGYAVENMSAARKGAKLVFTTTPIGTNVEQIQMILNHNGNLGLGVSAATSYKLDVAGDINASGCVRASGSVLGGTCASDEILKSDIRPFDLGLEALLGISPKTFKYNGLGGYPASKTPELGVIAQDIEKMAPELIVSKSVQLRPDDKIMTTIKQVNYTTFTYVLINAVKELYHRWVQDSDDIRHELTAKDREIASLKERVAKSETENDRIKRYLCGKDPAAELCQSRR